jgi:hypothetical protein
MRMEFSLHKGGFYRTFILQSYILFGLFDGATFLDDYNAYFFIFSYSLRTHLPVCWLDCISTHCWLVHV